MNVLPFSVAAAVVGERIRIVVVVGAGAGAGVVGVVIFFGDDERLSDGGVVTAEVL